MREQTIYFLFTDTGTYLARAINYCTKQSLNHVSIAFDRDLTDVYSFGRKQPNNPFTGGFVKEDIHSDFLKDSICAIYAFQLTKNDCENVLRKIKAIEAEKQTYKYNFLGLIGILLQVQIERDYALFCSQFVATVLHDVEAFQIQKPSCFVTPGDIRNHAGMRLVYQGRLDDYDGDQYCSQTKSGQQQEQESATGIPREQVLPKQSLI